MSFLTFAYNPDIGAEKTVKPAVHPIKFGDGYEARIAVGINFKPKTWSVKFTGTSAQAIAIDAFLDTAGGITPFTWVDPNNVTANYVCRDWKRIQTDFGIHVVSASFEQVFDY